MEHSPFSSHLLCILIVFHCIYLYIMLKFNVEFQLFYHYNIIVKLRERRDKMFKILFVCHGNICRSPTAEYVMRDIVKKAGLEKYISVASAATSYKEVGSPVYPMARDLLNKHGIDCSEKRSRQLRYEDYAEYDMLIGMDEMNIKNMTRMCGGDKEGKISLLMDYTSRPGSVADPWFTRDFDAAWKDICEGCEGLLKYLKSQVKIAI